MTVQNGSDGGPLLTPAFITLTLSELAYFTALGLMIPVVTLFATDSLAVGSAAVGVAIGAFSITALLLRPLAGWVADRWGRRRLMVAGALLFSAVIAAHLLVTQFWVLLGLRVLLGVAEAAFFVAGVAALADLAPAERLGEALSYNSLGLYLGITAGPALGDWLLGIGGYPAAWVSAAALGLLATFMATRLPALPGRPGEASGASLLPARLIAPGLAFVAGLAGAAGFLGFAALYARDLGMSGAGGVLFVYGAVVVACRILFAKFSDRAPAVRVSAAALTACAAGLAVMSLLRTPIALIAGAVVLAVGMAFLTPAFYRVLMSRLPTGQRGTAAATFSIMVDLGLGGGPILFGLIVRPAGIPAALATGAALALLAAVLTARAAAHTPRPRLPE